MNVPSYLRGLSSLLSASSARVTANYLVWRAVSSSLSYLPRQAELISLRFSTAVSGKTELPARWLKCVSTTSSTLGNAVGSLYVGKYFRENSRQAAVEMVREIRTQFGLMLDHLDWMDEKTRANAREKADAMETHIGYPTELLDMETLDQVTLLQLLALHHIFLSALLGAGALRQRLLWERSEDNFVRDQLRLLQTEGESQQNRLGESQSFIDKVGAR